MSAVPRIDPEAVRERLEAVRAVIADAGRDDVEIVAVTKAFGADAVAAAVAAGCPRIGENYAQELVAKHRAEPEAFASAEVYFIGQLQSNKVRSLVGLVDVYASVDRTSLVRELAKRAPGARVLVQVDATGEPGKGGAPIDGVPELVAAASGSGLVVEGLMTVGPTEGGPEAARLPFRRVRALTDDLGLAVCSMGMTADLRVALDEGTTQIRVGTALFGPRPPRR